jgi:predicted dehydrogenase
MAGMTSRNYRLSRRAFIQQITVAGLAFPFVSRLGAASANSLLNHASFGAAGQAGADLNAITATKLVNLVAVADVDLNRTAELRKRYPDTRVYQDWRELLDKEQKNIDSVNVSTPDHMHAPIALAAIQLGKHVYNEKPLTHNVFEARRVTQRAHDAGLVTQMGIQIHSSTEYRTAVKLIQDLTIGKVKEVHTWSSKKWGDMEPVPDRSDPVPASLNWDFWLGVAAPRPFLQGYYHPSNWRKRLDFGTGTFGDMGCHIWDPVYKSLSLTAPISVRSEGPAPGPQNWSINAVIHYVFPGTAYTEGKTINITWYDGDMRPPQEIRALLGKTRMPDQGSIFIGTKGVMLLPHIGSPDLLPEEKFENFRIERVLSDNHYRQFVEACRGNGKTSANFDYSGPLTETVLLGGVATHFPRQTLEWDAAAVQFRNVAAANAFLRRKYRPGWEPKGI